MTKCRSNLVKFDMVKSWSVLVMKGNNLSTCFRKISLGAVVFFFFPSLDAENSSDPWFILLFLLRCYLVCL